MKTTRTRKSNDRTSPANPASASPWIMATVLLLIATVAAAMLSLKHIWSIELVGCGQGGGCDEIIRGKWGTIAGWPVAFLGLAYFSGWLTFCLASRRSVLPSWLRLIAAIGSLVSLGYIAIMIGDGHYCVWCLTTHAANLAFTTVFFTQYRFAAVALPGAATIAAALFGVILLSLAQFTYASQKQTVTIRETAKGAESIARIAAPTESSKRFGGRYWTGAKDAAVRIVIFHDFRCELCYKAEQQIDALVNSRVDVAVSYKQFPFDASCNAQMGGTTPHPTACLAAKAVEAAGILGGAGPYWAMHKALMEARDITLNFVTGEAQQLGLDPLAFQTTLQSPQVDSLIQADIAEGVTFGLTYTPLIFVNGYPVLGWQSVNVLPDAINRAAMFAKQQPKMSDQPDSAAYEHLRLWNATKPSAMATDNRAPLLGSADAPTSIVMFGDITCPFNAAAMNVLKPLIASRTDVKLFYYHFPLDLDCNPLMKQQINQFACEATRIVEGIRQLKGDDAYRQAVLWVIDNQSRIGAPAMAELGQKFGIDAAGVAKLLASPQTAAAQKADMDRALKMNVSTSPTIYVNGKLLSNWRIPGLFPKILDEVRPRI